MKEPAPAFPAPAGRAALDPPRRPLVELALAGALGSALGASAAGAWPAGLDGTPRWAAPAALLVLAWLLARRRRSPPPEWARSPASGGGPSPAPLFPLPRPWTLPFALSCALAAKLAPPLPPPHDPPPPAALAEARTALLAGRWRPLGRGSGWVDEGEPPAVRLRLSCVGPAPPAGARVLVLPGDELVPWPRGPVPGPRAAAGRFDAASRVRPDELVVLDPWPREEPGPLARWRERWLARLEQLDRRIGGDGLLCALLLGADERVGPATVERFTRTGTRHLLAVSGLHVGLVAWAAALVAWRLARGGAGRGAALASVLALALYAAVTCARAPVVRAALAAGLALVAPFVRLARRARSRAGGRRPDALSLWGLALAIELARDPWAVTRTGVALSYLATLGLLAGGRRRPAVATRADPLPSRRASALRALGRPARGVAAGAATSLRASATAVLASLPVAWSAFGELAPAGVLATAALVPPLFALMALGLWECLLPGFVPDAPARAVMGALHALLAAFDRLPGTPVLLPARPGWLLFAASALAFAAWRGGRPRGAAGRLACLAWSALLLPWTTAPRASEVVALDVGAGTCVAVRGPGLPLLLFDAGSRNRRHLWDEALAPLARAWDAPSPVVVLSHADRDHAGALPTVTSRLVPRWWAGAPAAGVTLAPGTPRADALVGPFAFVPGRGWRAELVRGARVLGNEGSRNLLLVDPNGARILLCGDAEEHGLQRALRAGWLDGPVDLLLFPHHGSETSELARLLAAARPREVWISGEGRPPVADELARRGIPWRATGLEGPLRALFPNVSPPGEGRTRFARNSGRERG